MRDGQNKVAILTWWHYQNYGTALQVTAFNNLLRQLGLEVDVVNYIPSGKEYATNKKLMMSIIVIGKNIAASKTRGVIKNIRLF